MVTKKVKKRIRTKDRLPKVLIDGKYMTIRKLCTNCKAVIGIDKGLCEKCFMKKMKGQKVNEKPLVDYNPAIKN